MPAYMPVSTSCQHVTMHTTLSYALCAQRLFIAFGRLQTMVAKCIYTECQPNVMVSTAITIESGPACLQLLTLSPEYSKCHGTVSENPSHQLVIPDYNRVGVEQVVSSTVQQLNLVQSLSAASG